MPIWAVPLLAVGFLVYFTCGFAETNRMPFDMPEAENELVAGLPHGVFGDAASASSTWPSTST